MIIDSELIAEVLKEVAPYDRNGEMGKKITALMDVAEALHASGDDVANRTSLAIVITGEPTACETLAQGYAKALQGHGLVPGRGSGAAMHTMNWPQDIEGDFGVVRAIQEYNWAYNAMKNVKGSASGGVLIIPGIYKPPYQGWVDEEDSGPKARDGAIRAITSFMDTEYAKENTPVVILTGEAGPMAEFFEQQPEMKKLFEGKTMAACTQQREPSTELDANLTVYRPLRLKPRTPSFP
jgi:hypothetical protein